VVQFRFEATIIEWRGPSPYFYAPVPAAVAAELHALSRAVSYGWGVIPVEAELGEAAFRTSLFPKDGGYLLPLKDAVRRKAGVTVGDAVAIAMTLPRVERAS